MAYPEDRPALRPATEMPSFDDLAREQGVEPVASPADLARPDLWESDEEYDDFLVDLYASRRSGLACPRSSWTPTWRRRS
ncbi:hypothetical protein [Pseudonocardia humida]|uniref:Uncharacterized protein n=1 Tax=Pseudonocardia humida TaxID=2800819 RepID=A0ABT1A5I4_9PSEU|nr:hypothetical protein [Pseudonocardia humida]MCO1658094.1 hypothetical protein [Pseudonocardia humida]